MALFKEAFVKKILLLRKFIFKTNLAKKHSIDRSKFNFLILTSSVYSGSLNG